jgi:hypothetical protein
MKIQVNGNGSSLAVSITREKWCIQCIKGRKLVLGLSSLVYKLMILSVNLLSLNTIRNRFLSSQELQNAAFAISRNTMNKIQPIQNPSIK